MKPKRSRQFLVAVLVALVFALGSVAAQQQPAPQTANDSQTSAQPAQQPANPDAVIGKDLANASHQAAEAESSEGHEENAEFKYSAMVQKLGKLIGLDPHSTYFISLLINFAFLALFFWMLLKSKVPQMFRDRTTSIQKGIREAQAASADAARRLSDIEARLAKLDFEVGEIRTGAEREAVAEEERIRLAAEEDKQKVVAAAEAEISAIARTARRDLKSLAASLAVDLASQRIRVDDQTDRALVKEFVSQFGKDGK